MKINISKLAAAGNTLCDQFLLVGVFAYIFLHISMLSPTDKLDVDVFRPLIDTLKNLQSQQRAYGDQQSSISSSQRARALGTKLTQRLLGEQSNRRVLHAEHAPTRLSLEFLLSLFGTQKSNQSD